jgi:hypothetical protein
VPGTRRRYSKKVLNCNAFELLCGVKRGHCFTAANVRVRPRFEIGAVLSVDQSSYVAGLWNSKRLQRPCLNIATRASQCSGSPEQGRALGEEPCLPPRLTCEFTGFSLCRPVDVPSCALGKLCRGCGDEIASYIGIWVHTLSVVGRSPPAGQLDEEAELNEIWAKEMERSVAQLIQAVDDLLHSDAVNRHADDIIGSVARAREHLTAAIDALEIDDPR